MKAVRFDFVGLFNDVVDLHVCSNMFSSIFSSANRLRFLERGSEKFE